MPRHDGAHARGRPMLGAALCLAALWALAAPALTAPADGRRPPDKPTMLRDLRTKGHERLTAGDYEAALAAANDILRLSPDDLAGKRLRHEAAQAILARPLPSAQKVTRRTRNSRFLLELEREMLLPAPDVIISAGRAKGPKPPRAPIMEPWERQLRKRLKRPVTVEFRKTPLPDALRRLAELGDIQIVLDPKAAAGAGPLTLARTKMPLDALLRWVGRLAGTRHTLCDGAVYVALPDGIDDEPVQRLYTVAGLLSPPRDARRARQPGPVELTPKARQTPVVPYDPDRLGEGWVRFIRASIAPESWERRGEPAVAQERPAHSIAYRNGRIVVLHTPEVQRQVADLLANFRRRMHLQVHVLCRFLFLARADFEALNLETSLDTLDEQPDRSWRVVGATINDPEREALSRFPAFATVSSGLNVLYSYLGDDQVGALLQAVKTTRKGTILESARLTCFNTQRAIIQRLVAINYVRSISTDEEPEIGNIPEGFILDVQPFVSADQRYITLVLQPQMRKLLELNNFDFSSDPEEFIIGPDPDPVIRGRRIQIPVTALYSLATTVTVPNGGTLLVGGFSEVEHRRGTAGIPILEHIPLLGRLFRGFNRGEARRTLFILVTAETVPELFEGD